MNSLKSYHKLIALIVFLIILIVPQFLVNAAGALSITPITWNVIGLDSNDVTTGPNLFPVGVRVCNTGDADVTNVTSDFQWTSSNSFIDLRTGSKSAYTDPGITLTPNACYDFYYEVEVERNAAAKGTSRGYQINASADGGLAVSTPTDRELYVEWLISQSRNSVISIYVRNIADTADTLIPDGGTMALEVGEQYVITLVGSTATNGYNQLESFINFPNTIFKVLSVESSYSAYLGSGAGTSDTLYADACGWENDITDPNYKSCVVSDDKAGGDVVNKYTVEILSVGSINPEPLNTELYDFSGSSFHYNSDYDVSEVYAAIIDPSNLTIDKKFSPNPTNVGGTSKLTFTITNPFPTTVEGASFIDTLPTSPGAMTIASPAGVTTSGCGTPTVGALAGANSVSVSGATVAANSSCLISVNVTVPVIGTYSNTTGNLKYFNNGTEVDTGNTASATLDVNDSPPAPANICNLNLATWTMEPSQGTTSPPPYTYKASNVATASATIGSGISGSITAAGNPANQWTLNGFKKGTFSTADNEYVQFAVDTTNYSDIFFSFDQKIKNNGPSTLYIYYSTTGTEPFTQLGGPLTTTSTFTTKTLDFSTLTNTSGVTYFRIYGFDANAENSGLDLDIDNITVTGCGTPQHLTLAKQFSPSAIPVGSTSTLTFTIENPNPIETTSVNFTDDLPSGVEVASPPNGQYLNCGTPTFSPLAGDSSLSFTNGTIAAYGTCTVQVDVVGTSAGPKTNVSGFISSSETSTNTNPDGYATDTLTVLLPPEISKSFASTPIFENETSLLSIKIKNPNQDESLTGVLFVDNLPTNLSIANPLSPAATNTCTGGVLTAVAGGTSISLTGATLTGGETCEVTVTVTSSSADTYVNTTEQVNSANAGLGNTGTDSVIVKAPTPGISFLKEISTSNTGPWKKFVSVTPGTTVYYRFTVENTGDVPLSGVTIDDPEINTSSCTFTEPLPVAVAANENHISTCVSAGVVTTSGEHVNTATAKATYNTVEYSSNTSSATYVGAEPSLSLVKEVSKSASGPWASSITGVDPSGDVYYRFTVENTGNVALQTINVTDPNITMTGCTFTDPLAISASTSCVVGPVTANNTIGIYSNTATAHGTYKYDGVTYDSSPSTANYTITSPDLIISKTNNVSGTVNLGGTFTWTILVTNNGTSNATFAVGDEILTDSLPTNATYSISSSPVGADCAIDGSKILTCKPIGSALTLAPSGTFEVQLSVTTTVAGDLINTAIVDDDGLITESDETNNSDSDTVTVAANSNLTITKTNVVSDAVNLGDSFVWTMTISNLGSSAANFAIDDVLLSDTLPTGANYTLSSTPTDVSCSIVDGTLSTDPKTYSCKATAPVSIASSGTLAMSINVTPTEVGNLANTVTVDPNDAITESNETDNTGSNTVTVSAPNLTISKTNTISNAIVLGDSFTWTITVTNSGTSTADFAVGEIILSDNLPTGANYSVTTSSTGTNCSIDGSNVLTCTPTGSVLSLAASGGTFEVNLLVTPTAVGNLANTATVDPNDVITESNETDNTGSNTVTASAPNLTIAKTNDASGSVVLGESFVWTITVTNSGTSVANFAIGEEIFTDTLPSNATYSIASSPAGANCTIDGSNVLTCSPTGSALSIAASGGTFEVELTVTPTAVGSLANTATVDPNDVITESNEADNTGSNTVTVSAPNLTIVKTNDASGNVVIGDSFVWTITVTNSGTSVASFAIGEEIFTDTLPSNATYSITSSPAGANCAIDGSNVLTCSPTGSALSIAASGGTFEIELTVTPTSVGSLANTATVDDDGLITESDETDNTGSDTVTVNAKQIDLEISKTVNNATPSIGSTVIFTLAVTNNGSDDASGVVVQDLLPNGYTYVTDSEVGGLDSYNSTTGVWTIGTITSTSSMSLDIEASVNATGTYKNVAEVSAANETDIDSTPNNDDGDQSEDDEAAASVTVPNMLGLAKRVDSMTETSTGTYQISYEFLVKNYGAQDLDNLQITDDLNSIFTTPTTYSVISLSSTDFTVNNSFDGNADSNLLVGTETLTAGSTGTVQLVIEVIPYAAGPFDNVAIATATHSVLGSMSDTSHDGTDPDGNGNGTPTDDSDPTPVSFGPNLFDPPIGFKWLDADNNPVLTWTMVWINNSNIVAINAEAYDEIPDGTIFYDNGITSGYPLPSTAPAGSTNTGVICVDSSVITTTTYCYYEGPTSTYPRGRIVWIGDLGPDLNQSTPSDAVNDIAITFNVQLDNSFAVSNIAYISVDLNGDGDMDDAGESQATSASASWGTGKSLPKSGFAKDQITLIGQEPELYADYSVLQLKIEKLDLQIPIVGIPQENNEWDVTWLGNNAGWLQNTAFPTSQGNTVITGHVYNQFGLPGPFKNLKTLSWGDEIIIIENGQEFVYKVDAVYLTKPNNVSSLANTDQTILTLITCQNYDQENEIYLDRLIVTAKLIEVR